MLASFCGYALTVVARDGPSALIWTNSPVVTRDSQDEEARSYDLADLLREIANTTNIGTVYIVAYSMGAEVLGHAMIKLDVVDMGMVTANRTARRGLARLYSPRQT